eukprot:1161233-Pelagomonas_calceolata.AAC.1
MDVFAAVLEELLRLHTIVCFLGMEDHVELPAADLPPYLARQVENLSPRDFSDRNCPGGILKKKQNKLRKQRKLSLHQLKKERHIGSKSRESFSPEDERGVNVDQ